MLSQKNNVLTVTDEAKKETVQIRGVAKDSPADLEYVLSSLSHKLNPEDSAFNTDLPVFHYMGQEKVVVKLTPILVRMRRFVDGLDELTLTDFT